MPTYEYVCTSCENHWEEVQKISEPALDTCPKCSNKTAKRQISGGNFILKGGGWYADLYSSTGKKDTKSESKSEAKSESKSESTSTKTESTTKSDTSSSSSTSSASSPAKPSPTKP